MATNDLDAAFEVLLEQVEAVASSLNESGAEALRAGDYEAARQAIDEAARLAEFREKVRSLQREWESFAARGLRQSDRKISRRGTSRLPRGLRTPEEAFRRPILEALVELGGSAPVSVVLDRVWTKMSGVLNSYDMESVPSVPGSPRWRNTAQWCRNTLVREGLMKSGSPFGIWEISEAGRRWLEEHSS